MGVFVFVLGTEYGSSQSEHPGNILANIKNELEDVDTTTVYQHKLHTTKGNIFYNSYYYYMIVHLT